jgi:rubrerythrin
MLKFLVGAEEADEVGVFDHLLARVDDPALQALVRRHRDDEVRHGQVFRASLARQPVDPATIPEPVQVIPFIDRELDGFSAAFVGDRRSVMEAYVLLQVIEERGIEQYPLIANAMERFDPESASVIRRVVQDETRHLKYAKAISKRYAPDAEALASTLQRLRRAEARAFASHGQAFLSQALEADLLAVGRVERVAWRLFVALGGRRRPQRAHGSGAPTARREIAPAARVRTARA